MSSMTSLADRALLTIAIPTFNRAAELMVCLSRIVEEIDGLSIDQRSLVNVYVSDNASTDGTSEVLAKFKSRGLVELKFSRNSANLGPDINIASCYDFADSSYVWVFGDDDVLIAGSLRKVLHVLAKKEIDILYVNNYWFEGDYAERLAVSKKQRVFEFEQPLAFVRRTNVMLTFISGLVVRSGIGLACREQFLITNLVQLSWVFPLLRDGKRFAVIEDFVVAAKGSNSGGYGLVDVFGVKLKKISIKFFGENSRLAKTIENGVIVEFFPDFILRFRRGGNAFLDENMGQIFFGIFKENWRYYFFLAPLSFLPLVVASYFFVFIRVFRRLFRRALI